MHPRLAEVMDFVERKREELLQSFAGVSPEPMRRRVSDERWSVAEIIDHLRLVESSVARLVTKLAAEARARGVGEERATDSVLKTLDHLEVEAATHLMEAPSIVRPRPYADPADAILGLEESRRALREATASVSGLALGEIKHVHRGLGEELDLYQWLIFLGQHEGRHARQIQRTLNATRAGDLTAQTLDSRVYK
jgi:hypothetical protein